jgi:hypothetical protein
MILQAHKPKACRIKAWIAYIHSKLSVSKALNWMLEETSWFNEDLFVAAQSILRRLSAFYLHVCYHATIM